MFPSGTRAGRLAALMLGLLMLYPAAVAAQGTGGGGIAGVVRDDSGAVLPGVTIEASSPALIEGTRTVVTDGQGRYQVVNLRPGTYTVTFTLPGFTTLRREGINVATGFTATVDGTLPVGALQETVTVTGEAPLVDVRSTTQSQVLQGEVVRELPLGKNSGALAAVLAAAILPPGNIDVGGANGEIRSGGFTVHGAGDMMNLRDGMVESFMFGGSNNFLSSINPVIVQESEVTLSGGLSAEAFSGGTMINTVPREGSNRLRASFLTDYTHANLQSDNLTSETRARGAHTGSEVRRLRDIAGGVGGPILQNRLWYFASSRFWISETYVPGVFYNKLQGVSVNGLPPVFFEPDESRRGFVGNFAMEGSVRLTWQASPRNKIIYTPGLERNCNCQFGIQNGTLAPEAINDDLYWPYHRHSGSWQSPVNNRLLLQMGALYVGGDFNRRPTGAAHDDFAVRDRTRNWSYGNTGFGLGFTQNYAHMDWSQFNINGSASYVTGSHALKIGGLWLDAPRHLTADVPHNQFKSKDSMGQRWERRGHAQRHS
ncbi:MAG: carboxypeptidase regulatory-like domain-containing protein [Acidobacteria bacterium]|nr:carboxypeptidase regulatory-like domain-containing protein [Acidobacteriota bacterium]